MYLNTQVDDMHLDTELYSPSGSVFRIRTSDLNAHKTWQTNINTRLNTGSNYFVEIGHNGNGDIDVATDTSQGQTACTPPYAVDYDSPPDTPLEFQKPLGTGTDLWPPEFNNYTWSLTCAKLDSIATWFYNNPSTFAALSHTFTHEELNNATYHDASREIYFNIAWLKQIGLWTSNKFSTTGLIPPAITGLHNGDAIKAWMDNGIKYVVGDNTRPVLRHPVRKNSIATASFSADPQIRQIHFILLSPMLLTTAMLALLLFLDGVKLNVFLSTSLLLTSIKSDHNLLQL